MSQYLLQQQQNLQNLKVGVSPMRDMKTISLRQSKSPMASQHQSSGQRNSSQSSQNRMGPGSSQRKNVNHGSSSRQSSQNAGDLGHNQRPSIDNSYRDGVVNHSQSLTNDFNKRTSLASHRSSNSAVASNQKTASGINKNRSSSKNSASGISSTSGTSNPNPTTSNLNVVHSKLYEQQQIINKHIDKEKKYLEKIKQLKLENKKLV